MPTTIVKFLVSNLRFLPAISVAVGREDNVAAKKEPSIDGSF
jgi:hypothetical protein